MTPPLLSFDGVGKTYGAGGRAVAALRDVGFEVRAGERVGLVGQSGSGKSTIARLATGLEPADQGAVRIRGADPATARGDDLRMVRRTVQMVFQNPMAALNPRRRVGDVLAAPLTVLRRLDGGRRRRSLSRLMQAVRLAPELKGRYPHELSGGQAQRVGIARALAAKPKLLVLDEPTSALDVTVQAEVLRLLARLSADRDLAYLFISHDLALVRAMCDRVIVLKDGRVVEEGATADVFAAPRHDHTRALIDAVPILPTG